MSDWNDMTNAERRVAVLVKVCGWKVLRKYPLEMYIPQPLPRAREISAIARTFDIITELPLILESADACIEHVGEAVKAKGFYWDYSTLRRQAWIFKHSIDDAYIVLSVGNGDLAPALCEAALKMVEGEES